MNVNFYKSSALLSELSEVESEKVLAKQFFALEVCLCQELINFEQFSLNSRDKHTIVDSRARRIRRVKIYHNLLGMQEIMKPRIMLQTLVGFSRVLRFNHTFEMRNC